MIQGIFTLKKCGDLRRRNYSLACCLMSIWIMIPGHSVHAEVFITEVAWMGTSTSQYEEWVELYNNGEEDISLTDWKLFKTGGTTLFGMTGTIPANTYYLICRTTTSLTNPLDGVCDEQGPFGGSGLNNTSDQLVLTDDSAATRESVDGLDGWPAGDSATKQTMQKLGDDWVTAIGTPGSETLNSNESHSDNDHLPPPKDMKPVAKGITIEKVKPDPKYEARMTVPDFGTAGVLVPMTAQVTLDKKLKVLQGRYEWSTGDGGSYKFLKNTPLEHTYVYPGDYTVVLQYYSNRFKEEPDTIHRKTITIVPSAIEILGYSHTQGLQLKNNASRDISLDGWIIQSDTQEFVFPKFTTIPRGSVLSLSSKVLGIPLSQNSVLLNPSRELVSKYTYQSIESTDEEVSGEYPSISQTIDNSTYKVEYSAPLPKSKTLRDIWNHNKWHVVFGVVVLISVLAYLAFHLYAKQDELI